MTMDLKKPRWESYRQRNRDERWLSWLDPETGEIHVREDALWWLIGILAFAPIGVMCLVAVLVLT